MALNDILAVPSTSTPSTISTPASAWGFSGWSELTSFLLHDSNIIGISVQVTYSGGTPGLDITNEFIVEIGTGEAGAEVTDLQIPYSYRQDTTIGYYLTRTYTIMLPEPHVITAGTRIAARIADSNTSALTYSGVKIYYRAEADTLSGVFDPMGMLGIFGI